MVFLTVDNASIQHYADLITTLPPHGLRLITTGLCIVEASDILDDTHRVTLKVPKLRRQTFETAIIERCKRREASIEESLIEMYLAGVSVRRVEDITEALWGARVSPCTVSKLNRTIYKKARNLAE